MIELIVGLPLLGSCVAGIFSRKISHLMAQVITTSLVVIAFIISCKTFYDVCLQGKVLHEVLFNWLNIPGFFTYWSIKVDSLTAVMLIVVTSVSSLVHLYSIGYMHDDPDVPRFMSYLSLFTFSMLMLVTSDNLLQLFFGWEGVGVCSYLLIGFWFKKESAYKAAMKAFIVNRVGDFAFIIGICATYVIFNSIHFDSIFPVVATKLNEVIQIGPFSVNAINFICIALFLGAMGKSAQIGLHTWLPDAMEGPTPVSALIHAATMVTAGVFLVARFSPAFEYSEIARNMIVIIGAITSIFAASIALTQNDIKKIIAYSTCSQLGYMFMACGLSVYAAGIFHLATHAFFKALLFLSAGSVIHAMSGEQDIRRMGNLWKKIPVTYSMFWIGSLAIAGFWPFAGYYSKDAILEAAFMSNSKIGNFAFYLGLTAAFFTTFYSWRLIFKVFHGEKNYDATVESHIHESPFVMLMPLLILAIGAGFAGFVGHDVFHVLESNHEFWHGAIKVLPEHNLLEVIHHTPQNIKIAPMVLGGIAIGLAFLMYLVMPKSSDKLIKTFKIPYLMSYNKYYFDEIYNTCFVRPIKKLANFAWNYLDKKIVDDLGPNGFSKLTKTFSKYVSHLQTGYVYHYAFVMLVGLLIMISCYIIIKL